MVSGLLVINFPFPFLNFFSHAVELSTVFTFYIRGVVELNNRGSFVISYWITYFWVLIGTKFPGLVSMYQQHKKPHVWSRMFRKYDNFIKNSSSWFFFAYFYAIILKYRCRFSALDTCNIFTIWIWLYLLQVTIAPRAGRELGYVRMKMDAMRFNEGMLTYGVFLFLVLF